MRKKRNTFAVRRKSKPPGHEPLLDETLTGAGIWIASNAGPFNLSIIRMKTLIAVLVAGLFISRASAQVSLELALDQEQFLPSEALPVAVKITNRSGQQLHLGAHSDWLTFSVESSDGFVVIKNSEVPVLGEFDLENSQMAIKRVDLQPYFSMTKPGRYKVVATLRIHQWASQISSAPAHFDIISGAQLWSQDFGVPNGTNTAPEVRTYTLEKANYLKEQLRLYVQVSNGSGAEVYKVTALGPMVSFSQPEAKVDRMSRLNVLWQTGAQTFDYSLVNPNGTVANQETYNNFYSRPRLVVDDNGLVSVLGGTRQPKSGELPPVRMPSELPPDTFRSNTNVQK